MNANYTEQQLAEGYNACTYMASYYAEHHTMPPNFLDFMELPLQVADPRTGTTRVVLIGKLTPQDMQDWATSEEAATRDRYLTELEGL